jgi:hypothetical protein
MAERKVKVVLPPDNRVVDGWDVPVTSSNERWSEYELEDGSVLRVKANVLSFARVDGEHDPDGNPLYATKSQITQVVVSAPDRLRRGNN